MSAFKNHILIEKHLKEGIYNLDVYDLKDPDSEYFNRVRFINSYGTLTVSGDFGNWVFCREFHPKKGERVSRGYWDEKLIISSRQTSHKYCEKTTEKLLEEFIEEYRRESEEITDEVEDWFEDLTHNVYDKLDYENTLYRHCPIDIDYEYLPYGEKRHTWLDIVYDAFNEICNRYE